MGFRATSTKIIASDTRIYTRKVAHELHANASEKGYFGIKDVQESGFDPVELWVMGPPCGLKAGRS